MPEIKELSIAVKAAEDWIDDLQRRLGWHDREKVYRALLGALHPLRECAAAPRFWNAFVHRDPAIDAEEVARVVFAMLAARLPPAEVEDAKAATPKPLHNLWPR